MISVHFQGKPFNITVIQVYVLTTNVEEAEVEQFYNDLCNIALYSIGPCFYHQSHPQLGIIFALAPSLHSFWSYFSTELQ